MATPTPHHSSLPGGDVSSLLDWLARSHHELEPQQHAEQLLQHLTALREKAIPNHLRIQLLDLVFKQVRHTVFNLLPALPRQRLPIPHRIRLRITTALKILDKQAQEHLNTLAECFNRGAQLPPLPGHPLLKSVLCHAWSLLITNQCHAPSRPGIWLDLHRCHHIAQELGIESTALDSEGHTIARLYSAALLSQMAQPTGLDATEFQFVSDYLSQLESLPLVMTQKPQPSPGLYWLDASCDQPAHAMSRRQPPPDSPIHYLACDAVATHTEQLLAALRRGEKARQLKLPEFADTTRGQQVLAHLAEAWGKPPKRRFPRRRQVRRLRLQTSLAIGHDTAQGTTLPWSEWQVVNESPNGFALMHVSGDIGQLALGQIIRVHTAERAPQSGEGQTIGLIRWTLSDNPEHIEIGIELVAGLARSVIAVQPGHPAPQRQRALYFPPIAHGAQPAQLLVAPQALQAEFGMVIVIQDDSNVAVHELALARQVEQTEDADLWAVIPDETH